MKRLSSETALLPSVTGRTATDSTACITGSRWTVSVGALACTVMHITHGAELGATAAFEWLCTASAQAMSSSKATQLIATMRIAGLAPNWRAVKPCMNECGWPENNVAKYQITQISTTLPQA